jgi:FixJ family two-component response regulator
LFCALVKQQKHRAAPSARSRRPSCTDEVERLIAPVLSERERQVLDRLVRGMTNK